MRVARSARARLIRYTLVGVFMYSFVRITKVQAGLIQRHRNKIIVKLRRGSGKDWQGMALKAKGLKA